MQNTTNRLKALREAIEESEETYIRMKRQLNADTYASDVTGVHDMILTPQGKFSTDPDDYIIASKNPAMLNGGGNANVSIVVNNTMSDKANVSVTQDKDSNGNERLILQISQKVASDYASGSNGWDNAIQYRHMQTAGRNLAY